MRIRFHIRKTNQLGVQHIIIPVVVFAVLFGIAGTYLLIRSRAATDVQLKLTFSSTGVTTNMCLDDSSTSNYVIIWGCNTSDTYQKWNLVPATGGFMIRNPYHNFCIGYPDPTGLYQTVQIVNLTMNNCNGGKGVVWQWHGSGTYRQLVNVAQGNACINSPGKSTTQGTRMIVYPCNGSGPNYFSEQAVTASSGGGGSGGSTSSIDCQYQTDTWSGDASSVGYSVSKLSSHDGNPASFSVKLNARPGTTEVVGYPSDQCLMYSSLPSALTSSFRITPPTTSSGLDYEFAYDIWLTTATRATANNWDNDLELMIWNYNNGQTPAGSVRSTLSDGSKVWVDGNNTTGTVSVVLPSRETSGTVNISSIVSQLKAKGYVSSTYNGILDVEYGIEAPYGGGQTYTVNSISVN